MSTAMYLAKCSPRGGLDFDQICARAVLIASRKGYTGPLALDWAGRYLARAGWTTFGVESVSLADRELAYLNTGDTYSLTVGAEGESGALVATTWGDWYESAEADHCEHTGTIRCGYCSEFTPMDCADWRAVVCESCGRHVDGSD